MKKIVVFGVLGLVALFALIQLIPYGRSHSNPPVVSEPDWDSPRTRELAQRACFDCHSNETQWAWYSNVAPASWMVQRDVESGRGELNFSQYKRTSHESPANEIIEGGMPPWFYTLPHPEANLSPQEKQELIDGLRRSGV